MKKLSLSLLVVASMISVPVIAQTETSGRSPVYRSTAEKKIQLKHTRLDVVPNFAKETMDGQAWITASPFYYPQNSVQLDAKGMLIHEVALSNGTQKTPLKYTYNDDLLDIQLPSVFARQQDFTLYIRYTARPNEIKQKGSAAIQDAKGLYFINPQGTISDKPTQLWTQGETESSSAWFPTIDKPNQKSTSEISLTVPDSFTTLSNGLKTSSTSVGNGLRKDTWVMDQPHAPYLFFIGAGEYAVVNDRYQDIPLEYIVEKEYEPYAKQIFGLTPEMMDFFSKKLKTPYPWKKYSQIAVRDYVSGAMENTTATVFGEDVQQKPSTLIDNNRSESTIAHELFHHWFGDLATAESWSNLTVNESFANYSEYLWFEHKYGKDKADEHHFSDAQGYLRNQKLHSLHLARFDYDKREDMFDAVSYNKGGRILHMLRNYLGDDAFFNGLALYLKNRAFKSAEYHDLRLALEEISGKDLNWFFKQWYEGAGHPIVKYTHTYDPVQKKINLTIEQIQAGSPFQFPLTVDIYNGKNVERKQVWINAEARQTLNFPSTSSPTLVKINADQILLSEIKENHSPEQALLLMGAKEYRSRAQALEIAEKNPKSPASFQILKAGLADSFSGLRIETLNILSRLKDKDLITPLVKDIERLTKDSSTLVQAAALNILGNLPGNKYDTLLEKAISSPSNAVQIAAVANLIQKNPQRTIQLIHKVNLEDASEDTLLSLAPIIIREKITSHMNSLAQFVAFYPLIKMQNPNLGTIAEEGFRWIMSSDSASATRTIIRYQKHILGMYKDNPQVKMLFHGIVKEAIQMKMDTLRKNPTNKALDQQVKDLNEYVEYFK